MDRRYRNYRAYLEEKYKGTTYRVGVDGGFSCPNRTKDRTSGGCSYCDSFGIRSAYLGEEDSSIEEQVEKSLAVLKKRYQAENFLLYFQAYSSTFAPVESLKKVYDSTLTLQKFRELIVSTRPDCLEQEKVDLLASYRRSDREVWVELGLQTCHDGTLNRIGRGHNLQCFLDAFERSRKGGLKIAVHLIFGLPGEDYSMMMETVEKVASLKPEGIKFHNLHIPSGSALFQEYRRGELSFPGSMRHLEYLADAVERIPPETVILRLDTDTPGLRHNLPGRFWNKSRMSDALTELLKQRNSRQGLYCKFT